MLIEHLTVTSQVVSLVITNSDKVIIIVTSESSPNCYRDNKTNRIDGSVALHNGFI